MPRLFQDPASRQFLRVPYGMWTCEDGREVLFDRYYQPIWERRPGATVTLADPYERVDFSEQTYFWSEDATALADRLRVSAQVLIEWDLSGPAAWVFGLARSRDVRRQRMALHQKVEARP